MRKPLNKEFVNTIKEKLNLEYPEYFRDDPVFIYAYGARMNNALKEEEEGIELLNKIITDIEGLEELIANCPESEIRLMFVYEDLKTRTYTYTSSYNTKNENLTILENL
jgi:hypothetical protein